MYRCNGLNYNRSSVLLCHSSKWDAVLWVLAKENRRVLLLLLLP